VTFLWVSRPFCHPTTGVKALLANSEVSVTDTTGFERLTNQPTQPPTLNGRGYWVKTPNFVQHPQMY